MELSAFIPLLLLVGVLFLTVFAAVKMVLHRQETKRLSLLELEQEARERSLNEREAAEMRLQCLLVSMRDLSVPDAMYQFVNHNNGSLLRNSSIWEATLKYNAFPGLTKGEVELAYGLARGMKAFILSAESEIKSREDRIFAEAEVRRKYPGFSDASYEKAWGAARRALL